MNDGVVNATEENLAHWRSEARRLREIAEGIGVCVGRVHQLVQALHKSKDPALLTDGIVADIQAVALVAQDRQITFAQQAEVARGKVQQIEKETSDGTPPPPI